MLAECREIRIGHLVTAQAEWRYGHQMRGLLLIAAVVLAHKKRAAGNENQIA